jgi:hypothetical protein
MQPLDITFLKSVGVGVKQVSIEPLVVRLHLLLPSNVLILSSLAHLLLFRVTTTDYTALLYFYISSSTCITHYIVTSISLMRPLAIAYEKPVGVVVKQVLLESLGTPLHSLHTFWCPDALQSRPPVAVISKNLLIQIMVMKIPRNTGLLPIKKRYQ